MAMLPTELEGGEPHMIPAFGFVTDEGDGPSGFLNADARGSLASNGKMSLGVYDAGMRLIGYAPGWSSALGQGFAVTYGFRANAPGVMPNGAVGFEPFSPAQIAIAELALQAWSDVANIRFIRDGYGVSGPAAYSDAATILFANYISGVSGAAAFAFHPGRYGGALLGSSNAGDIWVNSSLAYNSGPTIGNYGGQVLVHEIGHAIGLDHPSDYDAESGTTFTYAAHASYYEDSRQYTVMSYFGERNTGADFGGRHSAAPLLDDIKAAQLEYGANLATRTGDTVYGFNSNTGRPWYSVTSGSERPIMAVWDAGGVDTLDFSGFAHAQIIDLRAGFFSAVGGSTGNVVIADGVVVERALGGSGFDQIFGNAAANTLFGGGGDDILTGNGGNDHLDGGAGADVAVMSGAFSAYSFQDVTGGLRATDLRGGGPDGIDLLISIESIRFADGTVATGPATVGPIATAFQNILRAPAVGAPGLLANFLSSSIDSGALTSTSAIQHLVRAADATTAVAVMSYEFFTGIAPTAAGLNYLVAPNGENPHSLNSPYYQGFNLENRFINFSVNLGKLGEGATRFASDYAGATLFDATRTAYKMIFGAAPTDTKLHDILDVQLTFSGQTMTRSAYFAYYGQDGQDGVGAKAAMVGWLLAEAAKADIGVYALASNALLTDLADGEAALGVDLIGVYGRPEHIYAGG